MNLVQFIKLLYINGRLILATGLFCSILIFLSTAKQEKSYTSRMVVNTGVVSGYNIENHDSDSKTDRDYSRNELENLISLATAYETMEELSLELLAAYLSLPESDPKWIRAENYASVVNLLPPIFLQELRDSAGVVNKLSLQKYQDTDQINPLYQIIYSSHPFFGIEQLQKIRVARKSSSDLLEFTYSTSDPAVCRQTLSILSQIFTKKHTRLKERQSEDVLGFFEAATNESANKLRQAEDNLLRFQVDNNIINYYEQTRFIANKKEDLDELFFKEAMDLEATRSTLKRLEDQMKDRGKAAQLNQLLLDRKSELSLITQNLAQDGISELLGESNSAKGSNVLASRLQSLEKDMKGIAREALLIDQTPEGLATDELLSSWLKAIIGLEQATARLAVIKDRKVEFRDIYSQFAPWGSSLKKIEREIALAEDAYLENLHSYNQARLHLQNTTMAGNLYVLDAPYYPTKEQASKRMILVVVGFLIGCILPLSVIILLEFIDQTLKYPLEAAEKVGLPLAAVFPLFPLKRKSSLANVDFSSIRGQACDLLIQQMDLKTMDKKKVPKLFSFLSTRGKEGTSFISSLIAERLRREGKKVLFLFPDSKIDSDKPPIGPSPDNIPYQNVHSELLPALENSKDYDYVLYELPRLLSGRYSLEAAQKSDEAMLVCRANRTWSSADQKALNTFKEASGKNPGLIINGAPLQAIEHYLGEVPRSRSKLRQRLKQIATFNFSGSVKL